MAFAGARDGRTGVFGRGSAPECQKEQIGYTALKSAGAGSCTFYGRNAPACEPFV